MKRIIVKIGRALTVLALTYFPSLADAMFVEGENPSGQPQNVPLGDSAMNLSFLALGLFFAAVVVYRMTKRKKAVPEQA